MLCKDGNKTVPGTIQNPTACEEHYTFSVQGAAGAPVIVGFDPAGVTLGGMQSAGLSVTVWAQPWAIPGTLHMLTIKATSQAEGGCPPLNDSGCTATLWVSIEAVDLDVDSNNNGGQDPEAGIGDLADLDGDGLPDEDEDEAYYFSPWFVGKYIWTNNDDSNGNNVRDLEGADALTVNGVADLLDLFVLRARPINSQLAQEPHVFLEIDTAAYLRIFSARATDAVPLLGVNVPDDGDGNPLRRRVHSRLDGPSLRSRGRRDWHNAHNAEPLRRRDVRMRG